MHAHVIDSTDAKVKLDELSPEPPKKANKEDAGTQLAAVSKELFELQEMMWGARTHGLLVVLQGRDAAGKDGAIKNVASAFNPRGVIVTSFGVPTQEEREHDFIWRIHKHAPRKGEVAIFNRSHYEDVLVVRVQNLAPKEVWSERFGHIRDFEELLIEHDTIVVKFFLHISKEEQEERLLERESDPRTGWKLNVGDWKDREKWGDYTEAYEEAISRTATKRVPWHIVPSNSKWYRNIVVAEAIADALRPHKKTWADKLASMGTLGRSELDAYRLSKA